jgi:hypothetical protein
MGNKFITGLPTPPQKGTLEDLYRYVNQLYSALARIAINTGADVYSGQRTPTSNDGKDGDIWIERA